MKYLIVCCLLLFCCSEGRAQIESRKPVIGISAGRVENRVSVRNTYIQAVAKAGGIPVVLPVLEDSLLIDEMVLRIDGLLLTGGADVHPLRYGEQPLLQLGSVEPWRDQSDVWYLQSAIRHHKPVLAICRGEQLANVVLGGTLYQDLPSQHADVGMHNQTMPGEYPSHSIYVEAGSHLHRLLGGRDSVAVNSFHHQAVKRLAKGFKIVANSADGVVEAIEGFPQYDILGVQFHPEFFASKGDVVWLNLFKDLVERSSAR